jgi:hypothetical protein
MVAGITYGALNDWAMTFRFNSESDRGFWWGDTSHSSAQGAMSLTTNGYLTIARRVKVGGGEADTSGPSYLLHVEGSPGAASIPVAWIHNSGNVADYDGTVISTVNDGADAEVLHVRTNNTTYNNGTSLMLVRGDGHVGIGATTPIGKLQIGDNYTINASYGGDDIYIKGTTGRTSYDPNIYNTDDFGALITISDSNTVGPTKPGLVLYNDDVTAGGFSPMLLFCKRESGNSPFKATMAGIYSRSPLGTGDSNGWIDGELIFATAGAASQGIKQRMVINKEGLVGIGTVSPECKLDIHDHTSATTFIADNNAGVRITNWGGNTGWSLLGFGGFSSTYTKNLSQIGSLSTNSGTYLAFGTSNDYGTGITNQAMTIDPSGKVGIGSTDPDSSLMVYKSAADSIIHVRGVSNGADARVRINGYNSSELYIDRNGVGRFAFRRTTGTDDLSLLKLNDGGDVGIGTTCSPNDKLEIYGNMRVRGSDGFGANTTANYNPSYVAFPGGGKIGSSFKQLKLDM